MTSPILVIGGTGRLGRLVVPLMRDAGRDVRVLSRHTHEAADGIEYVSGDLSSLMGTTPVYSSVPPSLSTRCPGWWWG
jgi:nucleoside-diphosphate-sugar epimerase